MSWACATLNEAREQDKHRRHCDGASDPSGNLGKGHKLHPIGSRENSYWPVPPCPLWHALIMADLIGYMPSNRPTNAPVAINVATVQKIVTILGKLKAAINLSKGVIETPMANRSG